MLFHSILRKEGETLYCFEDNEANQCDPIYETFTNITKISCGETHSVAIKEDGTLYCWGDNFLSQCDPIYQTFTNIKNPYDCLLE